MHPTIIAYKNVFLDAGGYSGSKNVDRMEDYDLFMRMMIIGKNIATYPGVLYDYYYDMAAQKKRKKIKFRFNESRLRLKRFYALGLYPLGIIYAMKPFVALLVPSKIIWKKRIATGLTRDEKIQLGGGGNDKQ